MTSSRFRSAGRGVGLTILFAAAGVVCALAEDAAPAPQISPGIPAGYLPADAIPDSLALLPPAPAEDSAALAADKEISQMNLGVQGAPRWRLAGTDANLTFPWAAGDFACSLGAPISLRDTPRLYQLLRRAMVDAGSSTRAAKDKYRRKRPFLVNNAPTCTPGAEAALAQDGSYPSEHASIGWAWALILSEAAPERSAAILARGRAFAQDRVICNVDWQSDATASLLLAAATVARLHDDAAFLADLDAAKTEIAAARAKKLAPQRNCKTEANDLAEQGTQSPGATVPK